MSGRYSSFARLLSLFIAISIVVSANHCLIEDLFSFVSRVVSSEAVSNHSAYEDYKVGHAHSHEASGHNHEEQQGGHEHGVPHSIVAVKPEGALFDGVLLPVVVLVLSFISLIVFSFNSCCQLLTRLLKSWQLNLSSNLTELVSILVVAPQAPPKSI